MADRISCGREGSVKLVRDVKEVSGGGGREAEGMKLAI